MALEDFWTYARRSNQNKQTCFWLQVIITHAIPLLKFVPEVCDVIYRKLNDEYLRVFLHFMIYRKVRYRNYLDYIHSVTVKIDGY